MRRFISVRLCGLHMYRRAQSFLEGDEEGHWIPVDVRKSMLGIPGMGREDRRENRIEKYPGRVAVVLVPVWMFGG